MSDQEFSNEDFVYVDPDLKQAVALVDWDKDGNALPKEWPRVEKKLAEGEEPRKPFRKPRIRYYPWGSYKTMCKIYKLKGKVKDKDTEDYIKLDVAIDKLQQDPYWN